MIYITIHFIADVLSKTKIFLEIPLFGHLTMFHLCEMNSRAWYRAAKKKILIQI